MMGISTKTFSGVKYAGADWIKNELSRQGQEISLLGIKVANILGQVFSGIYHLDQNLIYTKTFKTDWASSECLSVRISRTLASYDCGHLTALYLCCNAARISMKVEGRAKNYLLLKFYGHESAIKYVPEEKKINVSEFVLSKHILDVESKRTRMISEFTLATKIIDKHHDGCGELTNIAFSVPNRNLKNLKGLVISAHQSCVCLQVSGLSPSSVTMRISKRWPNGRFSRFFPTWPKAVEDMKKVWDVDYALN